MENISFNIFWIFKLYDIKKWQNGKEKLFLNDSWFLNNLKNAKQILSWQSNFSKFLQMHLLVFLIVPSFLIFVDKEIFMKNI